MYSEQDLMSLYDFLRQTPEGHLKKMMVNAKMTEAHLRILLKVVRGSSNQEFVQYALNGNLPKIKLSPAELAAKESLWGVCLEQCSALGLISKAAKTA
jgi:hypothetical protein